MIAWNMNSMKHQISTAFLGDSQNWWNTNPKKDVPKLAAKLGSKLRQKRQNWGPGFQSNTRVGSTTPKKNGMKYKSRNTNPKIVAQLMLNGTNLGPALCYTPFFAAPDGDFPQNAPLCDHA